MPAVAIFWIDAEDHDWDEVKSCGVLDESLEHKAIAIGNPAGAHDGPVARVRLDASIETALSELSAALPQTEFTAATFDALRTAYRTGAGMSEAFGTWIESVLGERGLVVYDSADPAAKPLAAGVFDELATDDALVPRAMAVAEELAALPREAYARIKRQLRRDALERMAGVVASGTDPLLEGWLTPETGAAAAQVLDPSRRER